MSEVKGVGGYGSGTNISLDQNQVQSEPSLKASATPSTELDSQEVRKLAKNIGDELEHVQYTLQKIGELIRDLVGSNQPLMAAITDRMQTLTKLTQQYQRLAAGSGPINPNNVDVGDRGDRLTWIGNLNQMVQQAATVYDAKKSKTSDLTKASENLTQTLKDFNDSCVSLGKTLNELYARLSSTILK